MVKVLLALSALLVLAASQCSVDGNTYTNGDQSLTFGMSVSDWVPGLLDYGDNDITFGSWVMSTDSRWEITERGSAGFEYCTATGQYNAIFDNDCTTLELTELSDNCASRSGLLSTTFTLISRGATADCVAPVTKWELTLQSSQTMPELSGEPATVVFGLNEYAIVSIGEKGAIFQRWALETTTSGTTSSVVDFGSIPAGLACSTSRTGVYSTNWDADCAAQFCGQEDECEARGELWHGVAVNGFQTTEACPEAVDTPGLQGRGRCNPENDEWVDHPYDCLDQDIEGGCMFCLGRAHGREVRQCLDREGAICNDIFNSLPRKAFCTLEFECKDPASTITLSLAFLLVAIMALLL